MVDGSDWEKGEDGCALFLSGGIADDVDCECLYGLSAVVNRSVEYLATDDDTLLLTTLKTRPT